MCIKGHCSVNDRDSPIHKCTFYQSARLTTTVVVIHMEVIKMLKGTLGLVGIGAWGLEPSFCRTATPRAHMSHYAMARIPGTVYVVSEIFSLLSTALWQLMAQKG